MLAQKLLAAEKRTRQLLLSSKELRAQLKILAEEKGII